MTQDKLFACELNEQAVEMPKKDYVPPSMSIAWPADLEHKAPDVSIKKTWASNESLLLDQIETRLYLVIGIWVSPGYSC